MPNHQCVCSVLNQNSQKAFDICYTVLALFPLFIAIQLGFIDSCFLSLSLSLSSVCVPQLLIGFESGTIVMWDLRAKRADFRIYYDEVSVKFFCFRL